ncbi:ATP-binding cassette domain-containing protein [Streptomyces jeddahensis]|uniref:Putative ABC transporter ATP-binding protein n=1 Tax=Streptomyces jeddahensis TaxID=1716141 RepID=A0A177HH23_9ACTN|nr:ABC transporter ATP-binding protein [Streptomyces jeddahensis]OAH09468.1 putative ABC transporter ATP-binding protein [Streptomyces jeddahensis]
MTRRLITLWARLLHLCWRLEPRLTAAALLVRILDTVVFVAIALAVREVIDRAEAGLAAAAMWAAIGLACLRLADFSTFTLALNLRILVVEKVGLTEIQDGILRDVTDIHTLDHLEDPQFLGRVTIVRGATWQIMDSAWAALESVMLALRLALGLALLGSASPWLLLLLPCAALPLWTDARARAHETRSTQEAAGDVRLQRELHENLTRPGPGKEIRVTGTGRDLIRLQAEADERATAAVVRGAVPAAAWRLAGWLAFCAGFGGLLSLLLLQAGSGRATLGEAVLGITVATSLSHEVAYTVQRSTTAAGAQRVIEPLLWLREYAAGYRARAATWTKRPAPDRLLDGITLDNVTFGYAGSARPALDGVSVHIPAGSVVAVVGEYGSGKTTLVKLLCSFHEPQQGEVQVEGVDLRGIDPAHWRARTSAAFQDFGRYRTTVRESIAFGDLQQSDGQGQSEDKAVARAVAAADAERLIARLPEGLDTRLGAEDGGTELSEGQWQKLALARASMRETPLLLVLDEPTASLDAPSEHAIFERYMARARELAQSTGAVTVIVSHRFSTVAGADLILVLHEGRLVEAGPHAELVRANGRYAELFTIAEKSYTSI